MHFLNLVFAAAAMTISSVSVARNSLRLRRFQIGEEGDSYGQGSKDLYNPGVTILQDGERVSFEKRCVI